MDRSAHSRLGEYTTAAMKDMHRYRDALWAITTDPQSSTRARTLARKALRNYRGRV